MNFAELRKMRAQYYEVFDERMKIQDEIKILVKELDEKRKEDSMLREQLKEIDGEINSQVLNNGLKDCKDV